MMKLLKNLYSPSFKRAFSIGVNNTGFVSYSVLKTYKKVEIPSQKLNIGDGKENCADWNSININNNNQEIHEVSDVFALSRATEKRWRLKNIFVRSKGYGIFNPNLILEKEEADSFQQDFNHGPDTVVLGKFKYKHGVLIAEPVVVHKVGTRKTEMCRYLHTTGICRHGDVCGYAHTVDELRPLLQDHRYKVDICRHAGGKRCSFGDKCQFRHNDGTEEEREIPSKPAWLRGLYVAK